jgi:hypothetical protein
MATWASRLPGNLAAQLNSRPVNSAEPPAANFIHDGKLNMGPAVVLTVVLSLICWGGIFELAQRLIR